ncbi:MAG: cellulase family glycosylhydrolase [Oscillospiraceae bacterium]|nr:cellulase family glycosylhydrolase [Oscillospiraceae bacterium]
MNFKKIISIIAAAALCVTAAGCRGGEESSAPLESVDGSEISNTVEAGVPSDIKPLESYGEDSLVYRAESMNTMEFTAAMQPGWNLGNTLDATGGETSWGNPKATPELIQKIKDEGFNSIRIPITWGHMMNEENVIDASYLARTKEVINYALDADLLVFVNIHHDSWQWLNAITPDENDANYLKFMAIWEQLAEAYKDYPRAVIFESINEPRFDKESTYAECLDMMNKACVEIVRASGGNNAERLIVLPTKDTNSEQKYLDQLYGTITDINDPNIIATVHYYGYWPFSVNIAGETEFKGTSVTDIDGLVSRLKTTFIDNGIPVIIGEWGLLGFDTALDTVEHGEILKFFEYFCNAVRENGLTTMWWDNGQHINRYSYEWADPSLMAIIKQSMQGRSSTAERDFINIFDGNAEEKQLKLSLNGNTFEGIRTESGEPVGYTLDEDTLTLTADYVASLVTGPAQYGLLETLYLEFSAGPDWTVYVYNTSTPEFTEVEGRKGALTIPCDFKGTQLKTVEAKYISGGSNTPGSQNWTSFKQYGDQFTTVTDGVRFTNNFFNETAGECEIQFIFYFWNDTTVEYNLTVSDGKVVGIPVTAE